MIRVYTTSKPNADAIQAAAALKGYSVEAFEQIDRAAMAGSLGETDALVFDLTSSATDADKVLAALDILDPDRVPPILYILSDPSEVELITQSISMLNQDYSFMPLDPQALAGRLEILLLLGARRKLTMESAITDRLTGLYNRKYFLRRLEEEMYRSKRYEYQIGVHLVDVDFFSPQGPLTEQAGTVVMQKVGEFFKGRLRKSDQVARFKWDCFAILLPDIVPEDSLAVAKDIKVKVERLSIESDGMPIQTKISIGHAMLPATDLDSVVKVVETLEEELLEAKTSSDGLKSYGAAADAE
jgi:diguanylate cyclase (GGDEF)-like protein